jgi:hypothetical protein
MTKRIPLFAATLFAVGFLSDMVLHLVHKQWVPSLAPYFQGQGYIKPALVAGLTLVVALAPTLFLSHVLFGRYMPNNNIKDLSWFLLLAAAVGAAMDWLIYKGRVFGSRLVLYYKTLGAGFWGAAAYVFALIISLVIINIIKRCNKEWI